MDQMQEIMTAIEALMGSAEDTQDTALAEALASMAETVTACMDANPDSAECAAVADALLAVLQTLTADETVDQTEEVPA